MRQSLNLKQENPFVQQTVQNLNILSQQVTHYLQQWNIQPKKRKKSTDYVHKNMQFQKKIISSMELYKELPILPPAILNQVQFPTINKRSYHTINIQPRQNHHLHHKPKVNKTSKSRKHYDVHDQYKQQQLQMRKIQRQKLKSQMKLQMDKVISLFNSNRDIGIKWSSKDKLKSKQISKNPQQLNLGQPFDKLRKIIDNAKRKQSWQMRHYNFIKK